MQKKLFFLVFSLVITWAHVVLATPPNEMKLVYDKDKGSLSVHIVHPTNDTNKHFIRRFIVAKNGNVLITKNYGFQPKPHDFSYDFPVQAVPGDILSVQVFCSEGGEKQEFLTLLVEEEDGEESSSNDAGETTVPGPSSNDSSGDKTYGTMKKGSGY